MIVTIIVILIAIMIMMIKIILLIAVVIIKINSNFNQVIFPLYPPMIMFMILQAQPCLLTRLRLGLIHLTKHRFNHSFDNCINPLCTCTLEIETQGVSQKFPIWAIRHKLGISELWSRGVWGPTLKAPNGIWGKAPKNFCYLTHKVLESI